uniref:Uncharacterized protein n=1 Tax=Timema monikensis TaxID=170555 RepID=A0A7R9EBR4_9NEOP|nr:unnamed protein product [Timema monikensis]
MAISCGAKCAKAFLIIFNLIYWVAGCALLVMGAWVFLDPTKNFLFQLVTTEGVSSNAAYYVAYLLITLGCLVVLVGFFGCCGALQESKCMLVLCRLVGKGMKRSSLLLPEVPILEASNQPNMSIS